jgi:deoxycytidylate deaminase
MQVAKHMTLDQAKELVDRDEGEQASWGQQLRSTYHLADVFIQVRSDVESLERAGKDVDRYLDLLWGARIVTPNKDEYGMFLAHAASLRSADLSRQVGAAILDEQSNVLAVGTNEVPTYGGGQYWGTGEDHRDFILGYDSNDRMKRKNLEEVLGRIDSSWDSYPAEKRREVVEEMAAKLAGTRIMSLTEFGRAVHAEMEAILSAARRGVLVRGAKLYTTTFPCHNCAKHIVGAGIKQVTYIEPYPKSLANQLHSDAISLAEEESGGRGRVLLRPFVGVAPRSYPYLFSTVSVEGERLQRKQEDGTLVSRPLGLRTKGPALSYIQREESAAEAAKRIPRA